MLTLAVTVVRESLIFL